MTTSTEPAIENFTVYEGATFRTEMVWKTGTPRTPVNMTGFTARLSLESQIDGSIALTLTQGAGLTLGSDGSIVIVITAAQSEALNRETKPYLYDLRVVAPSTEVSRVMQGTITVSRRVTAPT